MAYSTAIGDSQPVAQTVVVSGLPVSLTTAAKLADADDAVNDTNLSGKKMGAMYAYEVKDGVMEVVVAAGSGTTDNWVRLTSQGANAALILTVAANVGDAAGITTRLNLVENAINAILDGNVITPA
jgi:hypothetical protein